jgi:hypothetical protein
MAMVYEGACWLYEYQMAMVYEGACWVYEYQMAMVYKPCYGGPHHAYENCLEFLHRVVDLDDASVDL